MGEWRRPHAAEVVVAKVESSRGQKSDAKDAFGLAELLRTGKLETRVFKDVGAFAKLRDFSRLCSMLRADVPRTQNRIKSLYRSRGVATPEGDVYGSRHRAKWLKTLTPGKRLVAEKLNDELDKQDRAQGRGRGGAGRGLTRPPSWTSRGASTCSGAPRDATARPAGTRRSSPPRRPRI